MKEKIRKQKIQDAGRLSDELMYREEWRRSDRNPRYIVLEDGSKIYPSKDTEGNAPGYLLALDPVRDRVDSIEEFIKFEDGYALVPTRDSEANAEGALFGVLEDGTAGGV